MRQVERLLRRHQILPCGTLGRYEAYPAPLPESIRRNISRADMVVIAATPRYQAVDVHTQAQTQVISEMLQAEAAIAFAHNKPLVVFVKKGTDPGHFLPAITQYIVLEESRAIPPEKYRLISRLLYHAKRQALSQRIR